MVSVVEYCDSIPHTCHHHLPGFQREASAKIPLGIRLPIVPTSLLISAEKIMLRPTKFRIN